MYYYWFRLVLPVVGSASISLVSLKQSFLHNLISENLIKFWYVEYAIFAFFLLTLIIAFLAKFGVIWTPFKRIAELIRFKKITYIWKWVVGTLLLLCGTIILAQENYNNKIHLVFQVNRYVKDGRWSDVLESTQHYSNMNPLLSCQTNFALFQRNILLDSMFAYPQTQGTIGLLMDNTWCLYWPEEASNIWWKLGLVNESLHWAHEALENKGPTSEILKRLGTAYMLKGDNEAAKRFFLNLKKVPFQGKTAEDLIRLNGNPSELAQYSEFKYIQLCMPIEDLISRGGPPPRELELLLKRNPRNKMAFDYMIAYNLLNGNLKGLIHYIPYFNAFAYFQIPRHVQEALILIAALTPKFDQNQLKNIIHPLIYNRFIGYQQIIAKHRGDRYNARQELQARYGDTYWYYLMFVKTASQQSESQREYQQ